VGLGKFQEVAIGDLLGRLDPARKVAGVVVVGDE